MKVGFLIIIYFPIFFIASLKNLTSHFRGNILPLKLQATPFSFPSPLWFCFNSNETREDILPVFRSFEACLQNATFYCSVFPQLLFTSFWRFLIRSQHAKCLPEKFFLLEIRPSLMNLFFIYCLQIDLFIVTQ